MKCIEVEGASGILSRDNSWQNGRKGVSGAKNRFSKLTGLFPASLGILLSNISAIVTYVNSRLRHCTKYTILFLFLLSILFYFCNFFYLIFFRENSYTATLVNRVELKVMYASMYVVKLLVHLHSFLLAAAPFTSTQSMARLTQISNLNVSELK